MIAVACSGGVSRRSDCCGDGVAHAGKHTASAATVEKINNSAKVTHSGTDSRIWHCHYRCLAMCRMLLLLESRTHSGMPQPVYDVRITDKVFILFQKDILWLLFFSTIMHAAAKMGEWNWVTTKDSSAKTERVGGKLKAKVMSAWRSALLLLLIISVFVCVGDAMNWLVGWAKKQQQQALGVSVMKSGEKRARKILAFAGNNIHSSVT